MEIIHESPKTSSFIPLADHQSTTPASFYDGPPVLHYHSARSKLVILSSDIAVCPPLATLTTAYTTASKQNAATNGHSSPSTSQPAEPTNDGTESSDITVSDAEIWVTSSKFLIYSPSAVTGLAIPYPTISLHAIQSLPSTDEQPSEHGQPQGLYMQLVPSLSSTDPTGEQDDDDEEPTISLTLVPHPTITPANPEDPDTQVETSDPTNPPPSQTTLLFNALSACSNLHPDPHNATSDDNPGDITNSTLFQSGLIAQGNAEGGLPSPMPGSGGWITAENMHEYLDAEGNWIGGEAEAEGDEMDDGEEAEEPVPLGPGAGNVHPRPEDEGNEPRDYGAEGEGVTTEEETKWQRTS